MPLPPFGIQSRFLGPQLRRVARNGVGSLGRLGLATLQAFRLLPGLGQILFENLKLCLLGRQAFPVAAVPGLQTLPLPVSRALRLSNGIIEHLILLFLALEPKDLVLRLPELVPGGTQLELHLVKQPLALLQSGLLLSFHLFYNK